MALVNEIENHALECFPFECVGYIENGDYFKLDNVSLTPDVSFKLSLADKMMLADLVGLDALVHSHPILDPSPSDKDLAAQKATGFPYWIIGTDGITTTEIRKIL